MGLAVKGMGRGWVGGRRARAWCGWGRVGVGLGGCTSLTLFTLWREIMHDMYRLWYLAEADLLTKRILMSSRKQARGSIECSKPQEQNGH